MNKLKLSLAVLALVISFGNINLHAQATASGTIQGVVTDQSQATVAGVQVVAKSKGTDLTRATTTSESGVFRFELLPVGAYTVTLTKAGFATVVESVEIMVGQASTVNVELKAGSVSEVIEVTSEALIVDLAKTDVSQNITPTEVEELPLLGRDVANLAYLAPGVKA